MLKNKHAARLSPLLQVLSQEIRNLCYRLVYCRKWQQPSSAQVQQPTVMESKTPHRALSSSVLLKLTVAPPERAAPNQATSQLM